MLGAFLPEKMVDWLRGPWTVAKILQVLAVLGSLCSILALGWMVWSSVSSQPFMPRLVRFAPLCFVGGVALLLLAVVDEDRRLRQAVDEGLRFTASRVDITVHPETGSYSFIFEKHFTVIGADPTDRYRGQFYCNNHLDSKKASQEYYEDHPVRWNDLHFFASLQQQDTKDTFELVVEPYSDERNYIPYSIKFRQKNDGNK